MTSHSILYFGCLGDKGHYLFRKVGGHIEREGSRFDVRTATPWGVRLDGGIFGKSPLSHRAGVIHVTHKDGWTAVSWADYSVDSRPGSHSTFVVHAHVPQDELVWSAAQQWPEVFGRKGFPKLTPAIQQPAESS